MAVDHSRIDALWRWAVHAYEQGDNKTILIDLQDQFDLNVNILLWCCWCGSAGRQLQRMEILGAMEIADHWSKQITGPIRQARRGTQLIPQRLKAPATDALYDTLKELELSVEKTELTMLADLPSLDDLILTDKTPGEGPGLPNEHLCSIARRNVMAYLAEMGTARYQGFSIGPIESLLSEIYPDGTGASIEPTTFVVDQNELG